MLQVTLDLTHSHLEESEDRIEIGISGSASSSSDAARALSAGVDNLFGGSPMMPGVPTALPGNDPKGKAKGKGKGPGAKGKKEPEPRPADIYPTCGTWHA